MPLNSTKEVLKVLPSLFEEFVDVTGLNFYTKKIEDGKYLCFAYNQSKILETIKQSNLSLSQVKSVHFAQIELYELLKDKEQTCLKVDSVCLGFVNNMIVQIPLMLKVETNNLFEIKDIALSKDKIYLNSSSNYINNTIAFSLSAIFIVFSLTIFFKTYINYQEANKLDSKIENLKTKYKLPPTIIQTKSILRSLRVKYDKQTTLREVTNHILSVSKKHKGQLVNISLKNNTIEAVFKTAKKNNILKLINKKYKTKVIANSDKIFKIEVKL